MVREFLIKLKNAENDLEYNENSLLLHIATTLASNIGSTGVYVQGGMLCYSMYAPPIAARQTSVNSEHSNFPERQMTIKSEKSLWRFKA